MRRPTRGTVGLCALLTLASAHAAENLPPLAVDPVLLGLPPAAPAKPASAPVAKPAPVVAKDAAVAEVPQVAPAAPAKTESAPAETPKTPAAKPEAAKAAPIAPVTPAPAEARKLEAPKVVEAPKAAEAPKVARPEPVAAPAAVKPAAVVAAPAPAVAARARADQASSGPQGMPPLAVNPALLDPTLPAATPAAATAVAAATPAAASAVTPTQAVAAPARPTAPLAATRRNDGVVHVTADRIDGRNDVELVAEGSAEVQKNDSSLAADRIVYRQTSDEVEATGNVRLSRLNDQMSGPHLKMKVDESIGFFESPAYRISREVRPRLQPGATKPAEPRMASGQGVAERLDFEGKDQYRLSKATYSTCPVENGGPAWFARVADLKLDYTKNIGEAKDATVVFMGTPILYSPWLSFPLNRERKSGLLPPTLGSTSQGGIEYSQPYYWNIAPEMDATITPRYMDKRGLQVRGEYRYMGPSYAGEFSAEYLGDDRVTHQLRDAVVLQHKQEFGYGFSGSLNLSHVSDDSYFSDLSTQLSNISQTNLLREGRLVYSGGWWGATLSAQRYQTLQTPDAPPLAHPYERLPQLVVSASRPDLPGGLAFDFTGEAVHFSNPDANLVRGRRVNLYPQLSYPLQLAAFQITPKIGLRSTRYQLDSTPGVTATDIQRNVPVFSLDTSLTFERDAELFGNKLTQTLEPRLYYLRVPYRDQSNIPVFDTGLLDFNFAQIFAENLYSGSDRIANANQATAAVTSRFLDPSSGAELMRVALGQRYYFVDQTVTLPGEKPRTGHLADYLGALSAPVSPGVYVDSAFQYNPRDSKLERFNIGTRYQPEVGKVVNAGYRFTRDLLKQVDFSGQWPLGGGWSGVGRLNYSFKDHSLIETVAGLEYTQACWSTRFVLQRVVTPSAEFSNAFFVQLELTDFSRIGSSPLNLLKRDIPGYAPGSLSGFPDSNVQ
ncbi:MAG TPA: LPS assembly protein LptD [Rhodocyclaceae bacterium]